jgi:predicted AAA+ superfamily ATPase
VSQEIPDFDLEKYLNHGGIPRHYLAEKRVLKDEMEDYTALYLKEEILDEALTRKLDGFSRLLETMARHSGDELAIEAFASDCGIKAGTFRNYLDILKDTLVGFEVSPFLSTKKRKAITRSKFFLFDVGVANHLAGRGWLTPKSELFGKAFEHWVAMELRAFLAYRRIRAPLCYWRSTSQFEVDFIVGDELAIEVKGTSMVQDRMLKGLVALGEENLVRNRIVVSLDPKPRKMSGVFEGIEILPWQDFLTRLWGGEWTLG